MTSQLTHPNTITIYDYGRTPEGIFYYAMEYLDGIDLQALVARHGPQPEGRVIHILVQVCGSLVEAHGIGLIHRDIKPSNIILTRRGGLFDFAKLVDFGLVKAVDAGQAAALTAADSIVGTPHYMAPEAIRLPDQADARSDLYAVGAVGYFLLAGRPLFEGRWHRRDPVPARWMPNRNRRRAPRKRGLSRAGVALARLPGQGARGTAAECPALAEALGRISAGTWSPPDAETWWQAHHLEQAPPEGPEPPARRRLLTLDLPAQTHGSCPRPQSNTFGPITCPAK